MYIIATESDDKVIIEPTLGQIVLGHNHMFVGAGQELEEIVVQQTGENRKYEFAGVWEGFTPHQVYGILYGFHVEK
jgi:hypothetical protein